MNDFEKNTAGSSAAENDNQEQTVQKKKKKFTIQSPYADYAADNDLCTEMMEKDESDFKPDGKQLLKTALSAIFTVLMFAGGTLACVSIFSCVGGAN